ncbi:MAG: hypothetical protein A2Z99_04930 [Treponema sp. GWB1_62_6]|nr:MAG: hypothetical protein A2Y36_12520 [Treponema sp. GWA1_62_8]OHE63365.1 MAG: hypothetical protein A2001_15780 [Treponema sp. GWC1_61_84]OHE67260.1 MAG: hypothetical protein A2Z99_04930 [Treponema sp. GWB1_62_6]OHE73133.1 MAG: hypothetical protein A2413_10275 [Treponema sp. RIFOXYC1_FULL_61_9]HCM25292.1 hypothetical protein [Treponema sp.]
MKELDLSVRQKFDSVLDRLKEPQSELSFAELGLVKKISYHEPEKTIVAYLDVLTPRLECMACSAVNGFVLGTLERDLKVALEAEFPGWIVKVE